MYLCETTRQGKGDTYRLGSELRETINIAEMGEKIMQILRQLSIALGYFTRFIDSLKVTILRQLT
jgi:hypothetical protein